jgi:hypothetical protein
MLTRPQASLSDSSILLRAAQRVLRPMARLLMAHGVNFPAFAALAKGVFVDAAVHDFPGDGSPLTDSRVSLLSGVHRREVKRLRLETLQSAPPQVVSMGGQIVARWCADPRFVDAARLPKPIPRLASKGGDISFERLVASVSKDIRPRAVLDEWIRLGVARLDNEDCVHLAESAFVPVQGAEEKAFYFGKNLHDHMAAAAHNLLDGRPPFLERSVYYDGLSPASLETLRELSRQLAIAAMQEVNRRAMELQQQDAARDDAVARMTFGVYYYDEPARAQDRGGDR